MTNLQQARIERLCHVLKLDRVAAEWPGIAHQAAQDEATHADFLEHVLAAENQARIERQRTTLLSLATLPSIKTLEEYDFESPQVLRRLQLLRNGAMSKNNANKFSPEVRQRAVRLVQEHRGEYPSLWVAVESIAAKIGCSAQTLLTWVKRDEVDSGRREGVTTSERERIKELERENRELRPANDILRTASAFFAQAELDRKLKS
jgi:transposase-like protein